MQLNSPTDSLESLSRRNKPQVLRTPKEKNGKDNKIILFLKINTQYFSPNDQVCDSTILANLSHTGREVQESRAGAAGPRNGPHLASSLPTLLFPLPQWVLCGCPSSLFILFLVASSACPAIPGVRKGCPAVRAPKPTLDGLAPSLAGCS